MGFREEKESNLIELLVEETYSSVVDDQSEEGLDSHFENASESNYIDSFLMNKGVRFYSGENYDNFFRVKIARKAIDLPKALGKLDYDETGFVSILKSEDTDYLISALSTVDPDLSNSNSMIIYYNGKQSRTMFFDCLEVFEETKDYLSKITGRVDRFILSAA